MLFSTYNIHYGVGADGKYDVLRIADAVAQADIICLQETVRGWLQNGYADQTAEIGRRLNRYFRFHGPMEADASTVSASSKVHEPSGASGCGAPKTSGLDETVGRCSWIRVARRCRYGA